MERTYAHSRTWHHLVAMSVLILLCAATTCAQSTVFTYQGRLSESGMPANGIYEMQFKLYDALTEGTPLPVPTAITIDLTNANGNAVAISNGLFSVQLDFGANAFPDALRYLEIAVRHPAETSFTPLLPRQQISSSPYAIRSTSAATADDAINLGTLLRSAGTLNNPGNPVDWRQLKNVPTSVGSGYAAGPGISITGQTISNTGVRTVGANGPLSSSGGLNPSITLSGVVPVANGGTGSASKNFIDLSTDQTISGTKTFSRIVTGSLSASGMGQINRYDPALVATLRWDQLPLGYGDFAVGNGTGGIAFDGANIWVACASTDEVKKLRISDGSVVATYPVGDGPADIAFDGTYVWVTNFLSNNVTKLRASDGVSQGEFPVDSGPTSLAVDGPNIWVMSTVHSVVTKLLASNGAVGGVFHFGGILRAIAFDGASMWVTRGLGEHETQYHVTKVPVNTTGPSDWADYAVGRDPQGVAFDGANIWVVNHGDNTVTKIRASDGAQLGTFPAGSLPSAVAYDGTYIWITNSGNQVTKLRASDGTNMGTVKVGVNPVHIAFDGNNIWVTNSSSNTVSKRQP